MGDATCLRVAVAQWLSRPPYPYFKEDAEAYRALVVTDHANGRPTLFAEIESMAVVVVQGEQVAPAGGELVEARDTLGSDELFGGDKPLLVIGLGVMG